MTHELWPARLATCSPEPTSYNDIVIESPAAARIDVPGEKATERTGFMRP
jgi:hypothetical protein